MSKKMMSMLLTLLFHLSRAFLGLSEFGLSVYASRLLPRMLVNHRQHLHHIFPKIHMKFDAVPVSDPWQNHIRPDKKFETKGHTKLTHPPICVQYFTLTPKINTCTNHLPSYRSITTAVQMAAPVLEIMNTPSYTGHEQNNENTKKFIKRTVLAILKVLQLATLYVHLFTLCSAHVGA
jgi:hypothetical protein